MTAMLLEWAAGSIFLILVVLLLRALLGRRMSARLRYALWGAVLLRLLVPVQLIPLPTLGVEAWLEQTGIYVSAYPPAAPEVPEVPDVPEIPTLSRPSRPDVTPVPAGPEPDPQPVAPLVPAVTAPSVPQVPDPPAVPKAPDVPDVPEVPQVPDAPAAPDLTVLLPWLGWIWLGGSLAMGIVLLVSGLTFRRRLRRTRVPLEGTGCPLPVYRAEGLPSPCLFGPVRPAVYLTGEAAEDPAMLRHVLAHEETHFRHLDHIWNLLRCAALCVHWWDPLVWLAAELSRRDGELACDEGALRRLGDGERAAYGRTLLALVTAKSGPLDLLSCATTMTGSKRSLTERVGRIAKSPKTLVWAAVMAVLLLALASACAFGQGSEPEPPAQLDTPVTQPGEDGLPEEQDPPEQDESRTNGEDPAEDEDPADGPETDRPAYSAGLRFSYDPDNADRILIEGLGSVHVEGCIDLSPWLYFGGDPAFCCPCLAGEKAEGSASWTDQERTALLVGFNVNDDRVESGAITGFSYGFTVELDSGTVTERNFTSEVEGESRELTEEQMVDMARVLDSLLRAAERYSLTGVPDMQNGALPFVCTADLDHDGVLEELSVRSLEDCHVLEVRQDGQVLWSAQAAYAHAGWASLFLCTLDGEDYILDYSPYMSSGEADYRYELFHLAGGKKTVVRENDVHFAIYRSWQDDRFAPEAIAAFLDEVNELLAHSVLLLNTDPDLEDTFQKQGRLRDVPWWLYDVGGIALEEGTSLLEGLQRYRETVLSVAAPAIDLSALTFSDGWNDGVRLGGLDARSLSWNSPSRWYPGGRLSFEDPAFLGTYFQGRTAEGYARWSDEDQTAVYLYWSIQIDGSWLTRSVTVKVDTGETIDGGVGDDLSQEELRTIAQTLAELMERAEAYKTSELYRPPEEGPLPFDRAIELSFSSGAGAWETRLLLHPDGSFSGEFCDADMAPLDADYSRELQICSFHGRFGDIQQVSGASWSLTLEELVLDTGHPVGERWIERDTLYISSDPYGFDDGDGALQPGAKFLFYTPEAQGHAPGTELYGVMDESSSIRWFWIWWPGRHDMSSPSDRLGCYGLRSLETEYGFFGART